MKTISECVAEIITNSPFLEEALAQDIINLSSLSRKLQPKIEEKLKKKVQTGAVVMALKRLSPTLSPTLGNQIPDIIKGLGEIIVRSNLCDFTYKNSRSLMDKNTKLMSLIDRNQDSFFALSQGVYETMFIVSESYVPEVEGIFAGEDLLLKTTDLSAVTIKLPKENINISGVYYYILKQIAWEGIAIKEIVSTTNEFTLIIDDQYIDQTFSILKNLEAY